MTYKRTPEQIAKYYERDRLKRAAKAIADGREPGKMGQPKKNRTPEEMAEYQRTRVREYYFKNHEKMKAYRREFARKQAADKAIAEGRIPGKCGPKRKYETDEEYLKSVAETRKRYYQAHRKELAAKTAERARLKRAAVRAGLQKYMPKVRKSLEEKRAIKNAHSHTRRSRQTYAGGSYTAQDLKILHRRQNGLCLACNRSLGTHDTHVDHWVPVTLGGSSHKSNIALLHGTCNLQKGAKHPHELGFASEPLAA